MRTYKIEHYHKIWEKRINALNKSVRTDNYKAAQFMLLNAKLYAPHKTMETINSIIARRLKGKGYKVESYVSGFKQNLFANRTKPYHKLNFKKTSKQPFFKIPQKVIYGKPALSPKGRPIKWTGKPGFWDLAADKTKNKFRHLRIQNVRRALTKE